MTQLSVGGKPTQVRIACALCPTSILLVKPWPGLFGNTRTLFPTLCAHILRIKHVFSLNICQSDKNYRSFSEHGWAMPLVISVVTGSTPCTAGFHCSHLPREISEATWHVDDTGVTAHKPVVVLVSVLPLNLHVAGSPSPSVAVGSEAEWFPCSRLWWRGAGTACGDPGQQHPLMLLPQCWVRGQGWEVE